MSLLPQYYFPYIVKSEAVQKGLSIYYGIFKKAFKEHHFNL